MCVIGALHVLVPPLIPRARVLSFSVHIDNRLIHGFSEAIGIGGRNRVVSGRIHSDEMVLRLYTVRSLVQGLFALVPAVV